MGKKQNIVLWVIIIAIGVYTLQFAFQRPQTVVCTLFDDAYYYLQIAINIADGKGVTFDGIHTTNGFHPLWLLLLSLFSLIPDISRLMMARLTIIIQAFLLMGSLIFIKKIMRGIIDPLLIGVLLLIPLYPRFFHIFTVGMESGLLIFLMLLFFYTVPDTLKTLKDGKWFLRSLISGCLLSLIVLTRLDTFFLPLVFFIYTFVSGFRKRNVLRVQIPFIFVSGGIISTGLVPFLLWNYYEMGTFATISSLMKVNWGMAMFIPALRYLMTNCFEYYLGIFVIMIFLLVFYRNEDFKRGRTSFLNALNIFIFSSITVLVFYALFVRWALFSYAFASTIPAIILGSSLILVFVQNRFKSAKNRRWFAIVVLISVVIISITMQVISLSRLYKREVLRTYDAGLWARENTDRDAVFAMKDSGCFGYFSERRTINLDGMVNDFEYQRYLRDGSLDEYLKENEVDYFVQHAFWFGDTPVNSGDYEEYSLYLPSRIYRGGGDVITVKKGQEVYRSDYYNPRGNEPTRVIIWRYE
jgi:hypothetical protein